MAFVLLDGEVTGGQVVAHQLMQGLRAAGHDAVSVFPREGPMVDRVRNDGFSATVQRLERTYRLDQAASLARALRAAEVTLVDAHTLFVGSQLTRIAAQLAGIPLVEHVHIEEQFSSCRSVAAAQRLLARATAGIPDATIAVSARARGSAIANGAAPGKVVVVHNGVAIGPAAPPPAPPAGGVLRVVCAARLAHVKGQDVLIEALALAGPGIAVEFAGSDLEQGGAFQGRLEARAAELGVKGSVRFLGHREDLPALLDAADALVLPSRDEGLPLVALEAMARARPVVAAAVGGLPELLTDGVTGLLCEPASPVALAAALARLRDEPGLRTRLGAAGHARVAASFTVEQMQGRTLAVYQSVIR